MSDPIGIRRGIRNTRRAAEVIAVLAKHGFRQILSDGVSLFCCIALVGLIGLVALLFGFMNARVPVLGSVLSNTERWTLLILGSSYLCSVPNGVYVTAYRASGLFVRGTMLGNTLRLAHLVIAVIGVVW